VNIIVRKDKRGLASAVVDGFSRSSGRTLLVMDADLQHPPEIIPGMLLEIEKGADIAIASRYVKGGGCQDWSLIRRILSRGATFLAHLLLPSTRGVSDPLSGFFMLNRHVVADAKLQPTGYKILLEILVQGRFQKVAEIPYTFLTRERGKSKLNFRQQIEYLKHLYSLMKRGDELTRFIKFCLVGLSGVAINEGLLWLLTQFAGVELLYASIISVESSIISNFILNDLFTFKDRHSYGLESRLKRWLKYNMVCLVGLGINVGVLLFLTSVASIHYLVSNLIGIIVATLWNYLVNSWWTWK
ncbi:MAG: GtrA family protein, partial [Dehalococcoidales bacterium]|nr:GtrA family protein [Dehalococcoidales bacterium]